MALRGASPAAPATKVSGLPAMGFGTYMMQGQEAYQAVRWALETGYRLIDTAAAYGNHAAVGAAIRDSGLERASVFVTSKIAVDAMGYEKTSLALETMSDELGIGYVDLVLLHFPAPAVPSSGLVVWQELGLSVEPDPKLAYAARAGSWAALEDARRRGSVRHVGVSNYGVPHLREMARYANIGAAVNQLEIHPFLPRRDVVDYCSRRGIAVQAYASLVQFGRRDLLDHPTTRGVAAATHRTPAQVLLRWALDRGLGVVPKSASRDRIVENFGALEAPPLGVAHAAALDALAEQREESLSPPTGCGPQCLPGQYLWSPDVVPALPTALDELDRVDAPFVEVGGPHATVELHEDDDDDPRFVDPEEREELWKMGLGATVARRKFGGASAPLYRLPWAFDLELLQRDVDTATAGWNWSASEFGHARPLLDEARLLPEFRDHFINQPAADELLFERTPYLAKIYEWFASRVEVVSFRLLRRKPLTAYGLHNDEDLHVRPDIRRMQIPAYADRDSGLLLVLPHVSLVPLIAARGDNYGASNPLLNQHAWPEGGLDQLDDWWVEKNMTFDEARRDLDAAARDFGALGAAYTLRLGRLHYFDTMRRHTLVNLWHRPRIALVLDFIENDWLRTAMPFLRPNDEPEEDARRRQAVQTARKFRILKRHLGTVRFEHPGAGSTLGATTTTRVALSVVFPTRDHASAFETLCGRRIKKAQGDDCVARLAQTDLGRTTVGDASFELQSLVESLEVQLDPARCLERTKCRLEIRVQDADGDILAPDAVDLYVRDDRDLLLVNDAQARALTSLAFSPTHGAAGAFLGTGTVYYSLAYAQRAELAVVLGSGGGFAPACVRQAQRDAALTGISRTVLVDGARGPYGRPDYLDRPSKFRDLFPEVEILVQDTREASGLFEDESVDLLIIDADHSHRGSLADALAWLPKLRRPTGVAVLHDTGGWGLGSAKTPAVLRDVYGLHLLNFPSWGDGVALLQPRARVRAKIDLHQDAGLDELYAEVSDLAALPDIAATLCARRTWASLPSNTSADCADALLQATDLLEPSGLGDPPPRVPAVDSTKARIAALLAQRDRINAHLRELGYENVEGL